MRLLLPLRTALGTRALTARPDRVLGRPAGRGSTAVVRILGARQVLQGVIVRRTGWHVLSAAVDLLHGASMLVLAAVAPRRWGRFAGRQALTAAVLVVSELVADRRR